MASGAAHEINNPLANRHLYSEALLVEDLPDSVVADLQVISDQAKRAAVIVRNLLQFARKSIPEISTVPARQFVERCMELKSHDFRMNNISATTNILLDLPEIAIDEHLMTRVLVNILSNAEHACVAAHGRGHVSVTVRAINGSTRISISDDGPGIPSDDLTKVFDPFFTTKEVGEGTGLGLSLSYGIIAQLGGNIWEESDGLTGGTFHVEVPNVAAAEPLGPSDQTGGVDQPAGGSGSPYHVLVVDDEPDLRNVLARILERRRHTVD
jgi:signal transduction histidine kinase